MQIDWIEFHKPGHKLSTLAALVATLWYSRVSCAVHPARLSIEANGT